MVKKILIRLVGTLACVAAVATAWDAEAGHRRHHRRSCCYAEPCCVSTCRPVCDPCCAPACAPVCSTNCCPTYVVRSYDPCCAPRYVSSCNACGLIACDCAVVTRTIVSCDACLAGTTVREEAVVASETKQSSVKIASVKK
jgi:hypothetical protein